jgi:hypothetical protein
MSLLNPPIEKPHKSRVAPITITVLVIAAAVVLWLTFRYYPEKKATERFFDAVVAGDSDKAYALWKPSSNYRMKDFLADWGEGGYYGPIKSYRLLGAKAPSKTGSMEVNAGGTIEVEVAISPFSPLPDASDADKSRKTKVVTLWVQRSDKSFSFPP